MVADIIYPSGERASTMATNMLQPTRTIGGQRYPVRRMANYLGADYIIVVDLTPEQFAMLGPPDQSTTYVQSQGKLYRWLGGKWTDFYPFNNGTPGRDGASAYELAVSNGFSGTIQQWLTSLGGNDGTPGRMGMQGDPGPAGPASSLSVGTVTAGSTPRVTIVGSPPNQTINFVLQKGDKGDKGEIGPIGTPGTPGRDGVDGQQGLAGKDGAQGAAGKDATTPNVTIGTVSTVAAGDAATASITGTAPNYTLNLGLPAGQQGIAGVSPTITIGTVTTLPANASATAAINANKLDLGIPVGPAGAAGGTSTLTIGTVTTLSPGTSATAAIASGKLNLGIPGSKRIDTYTGTTDANGLFTVTYPTPFATVPSVQPEPPLVANQVWVKVTSTVNGFSLRLTQRNVVSLLGVEVLLGATVNATAAPARVTVIEA